MVLGQGRHDLGVTHDESCLRQLLAPLSTDVDVLTRRLALRLEELANLKTPLTSIPLSPVDNTYQSVNHPRVGQRRRALDIHLLEHLLQELVRLLGVELVVGRELLAGSLLEPAEQSALCESHSWDITGGNSPGNHVNAGPRRLPVDLELAAVLVREVGDVAARDVLDEAGEELLGAARHCNPLEHAFQAIQPHITYHRGSRQTPRSTRWW